MTMTDRTPATMSAASPAADSWPRPARGHTGLARTPGSESPCCLPGARRRWSPPDLPADTPGKRLADRLLPRTGLPAIGYFAAVIALLILARILPAPAYLIMDAAAALGAGTWCALNFWRCRHAHCLITGTGWLALALFTFAEAGTGHSLIGGDEQLAFVTVLGIGLIFEGAWYLARRTNAVTPGQD
jgi:hypothetical protein